MYLHHTLTIENTQIQDAYFYFKLLNKKNCFKIAVLRKHKDRNLELSFFFFPFPSSLCLRLFVHQSLIQFIFPQILPLIFPFKFFSYRKENCSKMQIKALTPKANFNLKLFVVIVQWLSLWTSSEMTEELFSYVCNIHAHEHIYTYIHTCSGIFYSIYFNQRT